MGDKEQEEIIKKLREKVVKIDSQKPTKPTVVKEAEILEKAKEAGETIDDNALYTDDSQ